MLPKTFFVSPPDFSVINSYQDMKRPVQYFYLQVAKLMRNDKIELFNQMSFTVIEFKQQTCDRLASAALYIILYRRMGTDNRRSCLAIYGFLCLSIVLW